MRDRLEPFCRRTLRQQVVEYIQFTECGRYGSNKQWRMLRCRTCKARFSERKGTPLFGSALPEEKVRSILEHIVEGCGVRETGRLVGVHRDTVMRYSRLAGDHARKVHDELVAFSPEHPRGAA